MVTRSNPERSPFLPEAPLGPQSGLVPVVRDEVHIKVTERANTSVTVPEMPAVRPSIRSSATDRYSWSDAHTHQEDPITEQTGRATELELSTAHSEQRDRALLLRMDGVHAGQVISLEKEEITIGRQADNDLVVDDTGVSRHHARIVRVGSDRLLIELNARNGTIVQGERVESRLLSDGDFIQLGPRAAFRYSITDRKQEQLLHRLYESSNRDALTGTYNRKHFDERLLSEIAYAVRHDGRTGLILFDLDHFKKVNDTRGHAAGDAVLRHVAGIVNARLRTEDVFARLGGEEFAIILRGVDLQGCGRLAERLRSNVSATPTTFQGAMVPVTISLGCATLLCTKSTNAELLLRLADERLYHAKTNGRNRVALD